MYCKFCVDSAICLADFKKKKREGTKKDPSGARVNILGYGELSNKGIDIQA